MLSGVGYSDVCRDARGRCGCGHGERPTASAATRPSTDGRVYGLWPAAVEQGEIAAENALGGHRSYHGTVPVTMLKVVGVDLLSVGRFQATDDDTVIELEDPEEHSYRKLVIADGCIVGAILIARQQDSPHVTAAVKEGRDVSALLPALERGDWDVLAERQESVAV